MENAILLDKISVYYDQVCALSEVSLAVRKNDFLAVLGPNGGGKTTLLKVILGLVRPDRGEVYVLDRPPGRIPGLVGYVPQTSAFNRTFPLTVKDTVLLGRSGHLTRFFGHYSADDQGIATAIMKRLEISHLQNRLIAELSGGQLKRVLIARALAIQPQILLLDEPFANLDTQAKSGIYELLRELNEQLTIILVTHDIGSIASSVKQIACLNTTLHYHGAPELTTDVVSKMYGCPVELLAHSLPHRVLGNHSGGDEDNYARKPAAL